MARRSSGRRSRRRGRSAQRGVTGTVLAVGVAILVLSGIGAAFWWSDQESRARALDTETLCPEATGPVAMTAILLDLTDPMSPAQHAQLLARIEQEISDAARGTQFTLGVVSEDSTRWGATPPLCKPQDAASANRLTQNEKLIAKRYESRFHEPLQSRLLDMVSATGANRSPIMESLQALVADTPGFVTFEGPRRIILVTDLLQHSDALSFYRGGTWDSFRASPAFQRLGRTLDGAEIRIYQVPRPAEGVKDPAVLEDFWIRYFERQGAHVPVVNRLGDL
ncbi:hypothetical protein PSM7751_00711 [Pseudooceanicola marinus]|uniref:VWA domain-containing protein n=1 Tax=Pseudooceanicola marinus TaxID=396013 RepID=A0A1X6YGN8_9RHOB|nr:hypothetical protein PSM7751_00711 [Pseudooceanicola marinus]